MTISRRSFALSVSALAGLALAAPRTARATVTLSPDQARAIAQDAYIYGFPMIDLYRIMWAYFVDKGGKDYKGPPNAIYSAANVFTPADTAVQTPNSDTPYSFAWLDLRAEPVVLTLPAIEADRYYSVQLVDAYTYNFGYLGTRTTGNGGGTFMIAGPGWAGETPAGVDKVLLAETDFVLALYRTQLVNPADIDKVRAIQATFGLKTLSDHAGTAAPAPAPAITFPTPLPAAKERTAIEGFNLLSFILQFVPVLPDEKALRDRFAQIGIGPGLSIDTASLAPDMAAALAAGQAEIDARRKVTPSSSSLFGTRAFMKDNYVNRALGAQFGILGNSRDEAFYGLYDKTADGKPLTGANSYRLTFAPGQLPPAKAFWSITLYDLPQQLLVANPINRYLINAPMLPDLAKDADGGLTIEVSPTDPGGDRTKNWLPAPTGPFMMVQRIYLPEPSVLDGTWKQPQIIQAPT